MREELQPYFVPQQDMSFAEQVLSHWRRSVFHTLRKVHLARQRQRERQRAKREEGLLTAITVACSPINSHKFSTERQHAGCYMHSQTADRELPCSLFENIDIPQLFCLGLAQCQRLPGTKYSQKNPLTFERSALKVHVLQCESVSERVCVCVCVCVCECVSVCVCECVSV